ncbi:MAG: aspartate-semialdehyde dehydrogenase [Candidatus Cloacimonetes bacterium]|nr:aspartate-semialdehyde dehydrogenase [Candidatus Cloacimonadota bacterium]
MSRRKPVIALLGATGAVGREMLKIIHEQNIEYDTLKLLASKRSAGSIITCQSHKFPVEEVSEESFSGIDICLASAGSEASKYWIPLAVKKGVTVIDNCSYWRLKDDVPLVVPEVNPEELHRHHKIIGNPNCSTIQLVQVLAPLHKRFGLKRVIVSTYQSVSGAGNKGIMSLQAETAAFPKKASGCFSRRIAYNVIPQIGDYEANGFTTEEMKLLHETRKILKDNSLLITGTAVRVPVFYGHSESVLLQFQSKVSPAEVRQELTDTQNLQIMDNNHLNLFPTPQDCESNDNTLVGRVRQDIMGEDWINLWIVSNNLRKGAALNAVQIAVYLIDKDII